MLYSYKWYTKHFHFRKLSINIFIYIAIQDFRFPISSVVEIRNITEYDGMIRSTHFKGWLVSLETKMAVPSKSINSKGWMELFWNFRMKFFKRFHWLFYSPKPSIHIQLRSGCFQHPIRWGWQNVIETNKFCSQWRNFYNAYSPYTMTSWHGKVFRSTDPSQRTNDANLWYCLWR